MSIGASAPVCRPPALPSPHRSYPRVDFASPTKAADPQPNTKYSLVSVKSSNTPPPLRPPHRRHTFNTPACKPETLCRMSSLQQVSVVSENHRNRTGLRAELSDRCVSQAQRASRSGRGASGRKPSKHESVINRSSRCQTIHAHSCRSVVMGSTLAARRAGMYPASRATAERTPAAKNIVVASRGARPNNIW